MANGLPPIPSYDILGEEQNKTAIIKELSEKELNKIGDTFIGVTGLILEEPKKIGDSTKSDLRTLYVDCNDNGCRTVDKNGNYVPGYDYRTADISGKIYGKNNEILTPDEFHKQEIQNFTRAFGQELLKEGFTKDELADVIETFVGLETIEEIEEAKGDIEDIYGKKIKLNSQVILYNLPSFEHYKEKILGFVENASGDDVFALASKIEKSTKGKRYETLVGALKQLARKYREVEKGRQELVKGRQELAKGKQELAKGKQELAKGRQELAKGRQELAKGRQELALLNNILSKLKKLDNE